jgi:serine/threonine protein kinase
MDDHKELIGKQIGSYQVVGMVGVGGMGVVYEGHHTQLKRRTAIKILNEQFAKNSQIAERFWNEARIVSVIQHPGLVSVLELGELPGGAPYIIMEYLDGESLGHRIQRTGGRLVADTLRLGRQIASTLTVVHAHGVVHRDLKPDNVMIVADPEASGGERAKLLDFGIAKISVESGLAGQIEHRKTRTGAILGTPLYMAPEQCRGAGAVDEKADVYSLGVILFEMLSGVPPFRADAPGDLMALHIFHPPPSLLEVAPWVSVELSGLILRMLAKVPKERPSATEVAKVLEQLGAPRATDPAALMHGSAVAALPSLVARSQPRLSKPTSVGAGQVQTTVTLTMSRRFLRMALLLSGILVGGLSGGMLLVRSPRQPAAAATPRPVHWNIATVPPGATVRREPNGEVLGTTPLKLEQASQDGEQTLRIQLRGFREQRLLLRRNRDESRGLEMVPLPEESTAIVTWNINSSPSGAAVIRADNGERLGTTPLHLEMPGGSTSIKVRVQTVGYQERTLLIEGSGNQERNVTLVRVKKERKGYEVRINPVDD